MLFLPVSILCVRFGLVEDTGSGVVVGGGGVDGGGLVVEDVELMTRSQAPVMWSRRKPAAQSQR